jgi:predicted TIM-barrel fold metal-dependent hydrolase
MPYATGRTYYDADSHIMELPDFLTAHADPAFRGEIPEIRAVAGRLPNAIDGLLARKAHPPETVAKMVALGDDLIAGPKGYWALGAFNSSERSQALDQLGFARQLVFSTFAAFVAFAGKRSIDARYAAARAHNRAMAAFCADDPRLMGVGALPLDVPELAIAEIEHMTQLGLAAAWVPHRPCGGRSPGHGDLDPVWARLADAGIPFVLHVGGVPLQIDPAWMNTGRPTPTDWLGGGENVRGKDMTSLQHGVETFLGCMVLDGVFERHPRLRGASVELGAGFVPSMMQRLDWIAEIWRKSEPDLAALRRKPSEQIIEHLRFTPYPYEDVGALIRASDDRLYLFSSDYPHIEGGRHPLGRFERSLEGTSDVTLARFYSDNFAALFGLAPAAQRDHAAAGAQPPPTLSGGKP